MVDHQPINATDIGQDIEAGRSIGAPAAGQPVCIVLRTFNVGVGKLLCGNIGQ